jgi:hypothetical protein
MVFKKLFGFSKIFLIKKNEIFIIIEIFCCTKTKNKTNKKDNILLYKNKKVKKKKQKQKQKLLIIIKNNQNHLLYKVSSICAGL